MSPFLVIASCVIAFEAVLIVRGGAELVNLTSEAWGQRDLGLFFLVAIGWAVWAWAWYWVAATVGLLL
jgi:hypothetical protein